MRRIFSLCSTLIVMGLAGFAFAGEVVGQASVIDGDTLEIHGQRIRLYGIDSPESSQLCLRNEKPWRCGQEAALALADHIGRAPIACRQTDTDRYGRIVAVCTRGGEDLNAWMVAQGWAVAYRQYALDYVAFEEVAKTAGRGIWSSRFDMPWNWCRQQRSGASGGACHIKGNVSSKGERIYHLPGGRWYKKTKVDEHKGERWFCTEKEAREAGWRRSQQ